MRLGGGLLLRRLRRGVRGGCFRLPLLPSLLLRALLLSLWLPSLWLPSLALLLRALLLSLLLPKHRRG